MVVCSKLSNCTYHTKRVSFTGEVGRTLSLIPIYDWNCVVKSLLDATPYMIESSPPKTCPMRCYQYTTCKDCLNSLGGEGGSQECVWSVHLQEVSGHDCSDIEVLNLVIKYDSLLLNLNEKSIGKSELINPKTTQYNEDFASCCK